MYLFMFVYRYMVHSVCMMCARVPPAHSFYPAAMSVTGGTVLQDIRIALFLNISQMYLQSYAYKYT